MKKLNYIISTTQLTITVNVEGQYKTFNVSRNSATFEKILPLLEESDKNTETILDILDAKNSDPYESTFEGRAFHPVLVEKLKSIREQGLPVEPLKAFMERLSNNPSGNSIRELYDFLSYRQLPITSDGYFLAYKGVQPNWYSYMGNKSTVLNSGTANESGQVLNTVGSVIECDRNQVDDNRENGCSYGLHVGSKDYAHNWRSHRGESGRLLLVKIDPASVVSVPVKEIEKCRVCKYEVISEIEEEIEIATTNAGGVPNDVRSDVTLPDQSIEEYAYKLQSYLESKYDEFYEYSLSDSVVSFNDIIKNLGGTRIMVGAALQLLESDGYFWEWDATSETVDISDY